MSDSDDTDLLLLIPPDFFLVRSPDIEDFESDCDLNFSFDHNELKDSVVNELITQVNDLESRICTIENFERSVTHCSNCYDESLINQSVNSLTESDALRIHSDDNCGTQVYPKEIGQVRHNCISNVIQESEKTHSKSTLECEGLLMSIKHMSEKPNISDKSPCESSKRTLKSNWPTGIDKTSSAADQAQLFKEIDTFLDLRKNKNAHTIYSCNDSEVNDISQSHELSDLALPLQYDDLQSLDERMPLEKDYYNQSLAVPEVYSLLKEMEETQYEIENKLKLRQIQPTLGVPDGSPTNKISKSEIKRHSSHTLSVEDLTVDPKKQSTLNSRTQSVLERLKNRHIQDQKYYSRPTDFTKATSGSSTQLNYVLTPTKAVLSEDVLSLYSDSGRVKPVSPHRSFVGHNSMDTVKAYLTKKDATENISELSEYKESPYKNTSFKRQLQFEKTPLNRNFIKQKHGEQHLNRDNSLDRSNQESENKCTGSEVNTEFSQKTIIKNNVLDERYSGSVNNQSMDKFNLNPSSDVDNKNVSNEVMQQKLSSNNLLSLSELWNNEPTFYSDDPVKLRQKLEEEKYRRQHCERQIQSLQIRVLEEQEKLAVAIKVDQEKDKVILHITESWRKLKTHWCEIEDQRHSLSQQLQNEKATSKAKSDELSKKIERWEKEVSQALDLAAGYKEKCEDVQKKMESLKSDTEKKLTEANLQVKNLKEENKQIIIEHESMLAQLKETREKFIEEEELLSKLKVELEKSKKQLYDYEAEVNVLKEQKGSILSKIKDEKSRNSILEQQKVALQEALDEATKKEKAAREEARMNNERIEVARTELRALYQGQLETVVKEKLQEFQNQLEAAETALKAELNSKEKQWVEKANEQCRKLQEKFKMDKLHIEESCREEINKWKRRLTESERLRTVVESRLQEETNRRADIAQRLHSVMETQWREALNIISNPIQNAGLYEAQKEENTKWSMNQENPGKVKGAGDMRLSQSNSHSSPAHVEEAPFCKDGQITYRATQPTHDQQLKKYIQMLLERGPGVSSSYNDTVQENLDQTFSTENSFIGENKWTHIPEESKNAGEQYHRISQSSKPPWK